MSGVLADENPEPDNAVHSAIVDVLPGGNEAGTPPDDRSFRPDVQGLRAIAVALVVLDHAGVSLFSGGFIGVDVFFVVSGFVITGLLVRERQSRQRTSIAHFYARRARRILPAATLVLIATTLASYHWLGTIRGRQVAGDSRWAAVFLENFHAIQNGTNYFASGMPVSPVLHFWSLAVEEQFYLAFPLIFLITASLLKSVSLRIRLACVFALVIVLSLWLSVFQTMSSPVTAYYSPFTRAWELALGGLVAVSGPLCRRVGPMLSAGLTWLGVAGILLAAVAYSGTTTYPGAAVILPVLATGLVIFGGYSRSRFGAESVLGSWIGIKGGDISYSLYLWHFPVLVIAAEAASAELSGLQRGLLVLVSIGLAIGTTRLIESPIRHSKNLVGHIVRSLALGAGLVMATLVVATLLLSDVGSSAVSPAANGTIPQSATLNELHRQIAQGTVEGQLPAVVIPTLDAVATYPALGYRISYDRCATKIPNWTIKPCVLGDHNGPRTLVLLGDSEAEMWAGALDQIAKSNHVRLVLLDKPGCPPWLMTYTHSDLTPWPACQRWHEFAVTTISKLRPMAVVLTGGTGAGTAVLHDRVAVQKLVRALVPLTSRILILSNVPWHQATISSAAPPGCYAENSSSLTNCNLSVASWLRANRQLRLALESAQLAGARYVDLDSLFCTDTTCPAVVGHYLVYLDIYHILPTYAEYVEPAFKTILEPYLFR